jgi:hypothetical protein
MQQGWQKSLLVDEEALPRQSTELKGTGLFVLIDVSTDFVDIYLIGGTRKDEA